MRKVRTLVISLIVVASIISAKLQAQVNFYSNNAGELILSGVNQIFNGADVNSNMRFTMFYHEQRLFNVDFFNLFGLYTGLAVRNIGFVSEDLYQNVGFLNIDNSHPDFNKQVKIKRRSYTLGFPLAIKLGNLKDQVFIYGGGEYEWLFHYKQKMFLEGVKEKESDWLSDRVNSWIPSVFAGAQLPGGFNLKFKYYLKDFLNPDYIGLDFSEAVDYSTFESTGIWYISLAFFIDEQKFQKLFENKFGNRRTASL